MAKKEILITISRAEILIIFLLLSRLHIIVAWTVKFLFTKFGRASLITITSEFPS